MMGFGPKHRYFSQLKDPKSTKYLNDEDPATHKGLAKLLVKMHVADVGQNCGATCNAIINQCFIFYASWRCFFQAESLSYAKQVVKLMDSALVAEKAHPYAHCTELLFSQT
ncbi:hypothetical protein Fmac_019426 [Flemingia macrophylla]|uniref:Uncharacterized protein n=1 Tax=Flemingia macrophylla TaxID=520843 RepID=A0ABD1M7S4_9FABA